MRRPKRSNDLAGWDGLCIVFGCQEKAHQDTTICTRHKKWLEWANARLEKFIADHPPIGTQLKLQFPEGDLRT